MRQGHIDMKSMIRGLAISAAVLSAGSHAQMIYQCVDHGAISYQQGPCAVQPAGKGVSTNTYNFNGYTSAIHFEGRDTMWVSMANEKLTAVESPDARMYYRRVH